MEPDSELEHRHIEEQLGGAKSKLAMMKAELRVLADIIRESQAPIRPRVDDLNDPLNAP